MKNKQKILIIGLDAATLELIIPWVNQGYLPILKNLINTGSYAKMKSVLPVLSSAAWTTFMTGANPGKHGVFDFVYRKENSYILKPVTRLQNKLPTIWRILSEHGKKVLAINVPLTYPPEQVNGIMISGFYTPDHKIFTHPAELSKKLIDMGYQINMHHKFPIDDPDKYIAETYDRLYKNSSIALSLYQNEDWDFTTIVYRETDDLAHAFWHYMDASHPYYDPNPKYRNTILNIYRALDNIIGKFIDASSDNTNIFIMSDHGCGPLYKDVYLNEWLQENGYLYKKKPQIYRSLLIKLGITRENVINIMSKYKLGRLVTLITDLFKDSLKVIPKTGLPDFHVGIDWKKTLAYSYGWNGQIFINLKGREPEGIVNQGNEYFHLRDEICQKIKTFIDPEDGLPVVDRVDFKEDIFHGEAVINAPDIFLTMRDFSFITRLGFELTNKTDQLFSKSMTNLSGGHRFMGSLISSGPSIVNSKNIKEDVWLGDIAPTILHLFNLPIPEWMDGKVLTEWLIPKYSNHPIRIKSMESSVNDVSPLGLSNEEEEQILDRLHNLGYLG